MVRFRHILSLGLFWVVSLSFAAAPLAAQPRTVLLSADRTKGVIAGSLDVAEAAGYSLMMSPTVRQQAWQVRLVRGALSSARGTFDTRLVGSINNARANSFPRFDSGLSKTTANVTSYRLGLSRQFASGLRIEPFLEMERTQVMASSAAPLSQTFLGATMAYPLLRGRGRDAVAAERRAASSEVRAAATRQQYVASQVAYETVRAYWRFIAAREQLAIARVSEERSRRLVQETSLLVKNDEKPASDLQQPRANLATLEAQRITAERSVASARQQLSLVMGVDTETAQSLAVGGSDFPAVPDDLEARLASPAPYVAAALASRRDLQATRDELAATHVRRDAAADALQPRVDLSVNVNYAGSTQWGQVQQYVSPFGQDVSGLNTTVSLTTDLSFRNRTAEGRMAQQTAAVQRQSIRAADLERQIEISVATTVEQLRGSVQQLRRARTAVNLSRTVVDDEQKKYRLGMSTLFDVIVAEDRLTRALTALLQNRSRYAELVARLRFETQTLITFDGPHATIDRRRLVSVPTRAELNDAMGATGAR